ncbi:Epimerase domain-containing protein [Mycena indigotica]|uniref:Epimerase domain-containing protein n=1 Tax=Mycena indigotica TaxID=2126181 RepID=A0A8H6SFQ7_9AGAR|nr:Epimerase domain-containing protein [Mycena indigotica]KAF7297522.1 Epimerase domain-containing protein [Mycena indigotica]
MSKPELVFVTGASGFLGAHVVHKLLEKGYRVRAAARGAKADQLKANYANAGYDTDRFDVVKITDIVHDQFPEALAGVHAIFHLASPLPGNLPVEEMLKIAVEGTLNVVVQGGKAGVRHVVVTSSIASVANPSNSFTDKDWNPVTREQALAANQGFLSYQASKKLAELALWEWAEQNPQVEVTTLNPTFFYGPFAPNSIHPAPGDFTGISTNILLYNLLFPNGVFPPRTRYIDVRDVAAGHVRALNGAPTAEVGRKRLIFSSPTGWPLQQTVDYIISNRPHLKDRLITKTPAKEPWDVLPLDWTRLEQVLGMKKDDFTSTEATTLDTIDALVELEKEWVSQGWEKKTPPSF